MNTKLILLALSVATFSSCTTLYKAGQTPDDVYFSPVRTYGEDREQVQQQRDEVKTYSHEDRNIRFGINDPRWRNLDNDFRYNPFNYGFNYGFNDFRYNPYNFGFNQGYYYNPYFWPHPVYSTVFTTPASPKNTTPRIANLGGYNTNGTVRTPTNTKTGTVPVRNYSTTNKGSAVGNVLRQIITPNNNNTNYNNSDSRRNSSSNNNSTNNSTNNTRSYTPSSSSSSSSSGRSSSSGSTPVSRPPRGGGN